MKKRKNEASAQNQLIIRAISLQIGEELRMKKAFGNIFNNAVDLQFFVRFGTLCLCVLLADNQYIINAWCIQGMPCSIVSTWYRKGCVGATQFSTSAMYMCVMLHNKVSKY